jgi:rubredoxin
VHDEATEGKWEDLPADFTCPECGVGKEDYVDVEF